MLFTDGLANVGIIKIPDIVKAVQTSLQKIDSACSIFTFGYGTDHDQNMLRYVTFQKEYLKLTSFAEK